MGNLTLSPPLYPVDGKAANFLLASRCNGIWRRDWKCKPCQMQYHENDGPNHSPEICKTWKMKDRIAGAGKCRTNSILKN